jgi:hypothetical protein
MGVKVGIEIKLRAIGWGAGIKGLGGIKMGTALGLESSV